MTISEDIENSCCKTKTSPWDFNTCQSDTTSESSKVGSVVGCICSSFPILLYLGKGSKEDGRERGLGGRRGRDGGEGTS